MELVLLLLPLLNFLILSIFGRFIGRIYSCYVTIINFVLLTVISLILLYRIGLKNNNVYFELFNMLNSDLLVYTISFIFDSLTIVMLVIIILISTIVHFYSFEYMKNDPHIILFISYLSLFTFSMVVLVTSGNLIQLFIGWELVGFCSYLLISFWYTRIQASKSALKAMLVNRIGDIVLLFVIIVSYYYFKSINITIILALIPFSSFITFFGYTFYVADILGLLILIAAVAKSAQFGLNTWLPDAMEGPTPVSALLHAATMVTVGVFLVIRFSPIFEFSVISKFLLSLFGILTIFLAGTIAIVQTDLKKIIAYSTCSQIGYMLFICGTSGYIVGLFHLFNHAFFKALLFLSAGVIIHSFNDNQDINRMVNVSRVLPLSFLFMTIGNISLAGCIFLSGFYSKDIIIELSNNSIIISSTLIYWISIFLSFWLTNQYSTLINNLYLNYTKSVLSNVIHIGKVKNINFYLHEMSISYFVLLFILVILSIISGYYFSIVFLSADSYFFSNSIMQFSNNTLYSLNEFMPAELKILPVVITLFVTFRIKRIFTYNDSIILFYYKKWYSDFLNNRFVKEYLYSSLLIFNNLIERGILEFAINLKLNNLLFKFKILNNMQVLSYYNIFSYTSKYSLVLFCCISIFLY